MRNELEKKLADAFPFMRRGLSVKEQREQCGCIGDLYGAFGIDTGDGWFRLIWELCTEITQVYQAAGEPVDIVVDQVKEKYGTLRFYWHPADRAFPAPDDRTDSQRNCLKPGSAAGLQAVHQKVEEIVSQYENRSAQICEVCGAAGCLRTNLEWMQTLCGEHYPSAKGRA